MWIMQEYSIIIFCATVDAQGSTINWALAKEMAEHSTNSHNENNVEFLKSYFWRHLATMQETEGGNAVYEGNMWE